MYSSCDAEAPIAVLTPVEVEDEPQPDQSLVAPEVHETALEVETYDEEAVGELPEALRSRGAVIDLLTGKKISAKIVVPFIVVMFVLAIGGSWVVLNLVTGSLVQRFTNQLLDAGKNVNDTIIKVEGQQLELLRLMTNTEGVDTALGKGDAPTLQKLLVPLQANSNFSFVDVVDANGKQVIALRPNDPKFVQALDPDIGSWDVTKKSLSGEGDSFGNKWTELVNTSFGPMVYTGGPVKDESDQVVGAVLVAIPFDDLIKQLTKDVLANVTVYTTDGKVFGSSLSLAPGDQSLDLDATTLDKVFGANPQTVQRPVQIAGQGYMELVGGLVVRDKVAGGLGVAIPTNAIDKSGEQTRTQLTIMFTVVTLVILAIGLLQARRISNPINALVAACKQVGKGNLETEVHVKSKDETGVLAHNFNVMIAGLRERDKIRDTFGRYMTQQVSDAILKGDVKLGGETRELTLLMSDIRSFTTLSESMKPEDLVAFLNRYFAKMIDCVIAHDGVVDKFMGDAILVTYGAPVRDAEHPIKAVLTALDMRDRMEEFNSELIAEGHKPIRIGIGANTGNAVTGNIGSEVRMEYTVIGDAVNATQRTEDLTKDVKTDILITDTTAARLDGRFILGPPVRIILRGRTQETLIYPVIGVRTGDVEEYRTETPLVLGEAPLRVEQSIADELLQAAEAGKLDEKAAEFDEKAAAFDEKAARLQAERAAIVDESLKLFRADSDKTPDADGNGDANDGGELWGDEPDEPAAKKPE